MTDAAAESRLLQIVLDRFDKVEAKLEIVVRIQERQERHRFDINKLRTDADATAARITALEARVNRAVWMAAGGWFVVSALAWLYQKFGGRL